MTNKLEIYKCNICGNVIEILISGDGHPVCCGEEMERLEVKNDSFNSPDLTEKHSPLFTKDDKGKSYVTIEKHPMTKEHYIPFVQIISNNNNEVLTKFFYPDDKIIMNTKLDEEKLKSRSYCNIHGIYSN